MASVDYKSKLKLNSVTALILQLATAVSGILLPNIMIRTYGSDVNGLIASITQFLSYISLLETGVGGVVRAALYKPLHDGDTAKVSSVINACKRFFKTLSYIFLAYLALMAVLYPLLGQKGDFDYWFVFWLTLISGVLTFSQYYFSLTYQLLLQADQRLYIVNNLQTAALIINIAATLILVRLGIDVLLLRLIFVAIFLLRPFGITLYVKKRYKLDKAAPPDNDAIAQRWDGFWHHIAYFMHRNTDVTILTVFSSFEEISVYSIYLSVVTAIQGIVISISGSVTAALGNIYAGGDKKELEKLFSGYETFIFCAATVLFSVTAAMIVPFVRVYTMGVEDANYERELFAVILVFAEYLYVLRLPYNNMALAAGFFKDTRNGAFVEVAINIGLSLILVKPLGITGVAVGTACAMAYRTFDFVRFLRHRILERPYGFFFKNLIISLLVSGAVYAFGKLIASVIAIDSYMAWVGAAAIVGVMSLVLTLAANALFNLSGLRQMALVLKK